jgi:hypothetical protein
MVAHHEASQIEKIENNKTSLFVMTPKASNYFKQIDDFLFEFYILMGHESPNA